MNILNESLLTELAAVRRTDVALARVASLAVLHEPVRALQATELRIGLALVALAGVAPEAVLSEAVLAVLQTGDGRAGALADRAVVTVGFESIRAVHLAYRGTDI